MTMDRKTAIRLTKQALTVTKAEIEGTNLEIFNESIDSVFIFVKRAKATAAKGDDVNTRGNLAAAAQHLGTALNMAGSGKYGGLIQKIAKKAHDDRKTPSKMDR